PRPLLAPHRRLPGRQHRRRRSRRCPRSRGEVQMSGVAKLNVRVAEVVPVNELITRFRFVSRDGSSLPAFSGGAHTVVEMDDNGTRRLNPYSLMSDPEDTSGYEISVRRDDQGRGGSLFMHRHVRPGMETVLSHPRSEARRGGK